MLVNSTALFLGSTPLPAQTIWYSPRAYLEILGLHLLPRHRVTQHILQIRFALVWETSCHGSASYGHTFCHGSQQMRLFSVQLYYNSCSAWQHPPTNALQQLPSAARHSSLTYHPIRLTVLSRPIWFLWWRFS